jgi:putative ABC transport system substrate-binding protein
MAVDIVPKRLELFKEAVPGLSRVALLINSSDPVIARRSLDEVQAAANRLNIDILPVDVRAREDIEEAFRAIDLLHVDGVFTVVDPMLYESRKRIVDLALARRLPTMLHVGQMTDDGGLMSYAADYPAMFRRTAAYVDKIVRGQIPQTFPWSSLPNSSLS